jgi:hypothetical protein
MCTVLLPPVVNPIAVNKHVNINTKPHEKLGVLMDNKTQSAAS